MTQQLYLISDIARRLDVRPHKVSYLFLTRKLEEPALRLGNRRIFTVADARRVAKALGKTWEEDQQKVGADE